MNDATSIIYNYDQKTGEFLNKGKADISPVNKDVPLYPAFCTLIAPPSTKTNEATVFISDLSNMMDGKWTVVPDFRGQTWYTQNGNEVIIDYIGDPSEKGLTNVAPVLPEPPVVYNDLTRRQFWQACLSIGITSDKIKAGLSDQKSKYYIENEYDRAGVIIDIDDTGTFSRDYYLIKEIAKAYDIPDEQINALWKWAENIGA